MCNTLKLETAVILSIQPYVLKSEPFTARDITSLVRLQVNDGSIALSGRSTEDVDGVQTYRVAYEEVRDFISEVYEAGLLPTFTRVNARSGNNYHRVYIPVAKSPSAPANVIQFPSQDAPLIPVAALPALISPVTVVQPNALSVEAKLRAEEYVEKKNTLGEDVTLRQVQSVLKRYGNYTCAQIEESLSEVGFLATGEKEVSKRRLY